MPKVHLTPDNLSMSFEFDGEELESLNNALHMYTQHLAEFKNSFGSVKSVDRALYVAQCLRNILKCGR